MSLSYFYKHKLEDFCNLHDLSYSHQTRASKAIFKSTLVRIERLYGKPLEKLDLCFCQDVKALYEKLDELNYSENTKLQTISICIKLLKIIDAPLTLINNYIKFHKKKSNENADKKKQEIQNEVSIVENFELIKNLYVEKSKEYLDDSQGAKGYTDFLKFMCMGLFTLQPPVRASNFVNCKVIQKSSIPDDTTHNYLMVDGNEYTFIFNTNRKNSVLKQRISPVIDDTLKKILDRYLTKYYTDNKTRWFLKNTSGQEIVARTVETYVKDFGSNLMNRIFTINDIRSSYLKYIYNLDLTLLDKLEIIQLMGNANLPNYFK